MHTQDLHTIDEYVLGRLDREALKAFEAQLVHDTTLAGQVEERRLLAKHVEAYGELRLKQRIRVAMGEEVRPTPAYTLKTWHWVLVALLLGLLSLVIWRLTMTEKPEQLYATYYEPYALSFGRRGDELDKQLVAAGQLYNDGQHEKALPIFETVLSEQQEKQDGLILAIGICYLELRKPEKANESFSKILNNMSSPYKNQAEWYQALSSLQSGDVVTCKERLREIVKTPNPTYAKKASELLSKLGD
jgi:tetratricopeptide (TPR) repeat protein